MIKFKDKSPKILVIGDLMIDHYFWGSCNRISPEAPVPVIKIDSDTSILGGAGNVINNLFALGASASIISVIGECNASNELKKLLSEINIDTSYLITQKDRFTSKKNRIIASQQQVVRFDRETTEEISIKSQNSIIKIFESIVDQYEVVLLSDYGKGIFTFNLTQSIIKIARQHGVKLLVDPKGLDYSKYKGAYLLTPNKKEASEATNINILDDKSLQKALISLKNKCNLELSLITLSEDGVAIFDDEMKTYPTLARQVFDVTGAGDTVLASLGYALASENNIESAVNFANLASGVVVGKIGSATASLNEIIEYESSLNKSSSFQHIKTWDEIKLIVDELKNKNRRIIFTNGCFDILHTGHVQYLEKSKSFGDILILGLNSDESVRKLKGANRPINTQNDRAYILASLEVIDFVVIFDDETPLKLIELIQPDILVKGGDYENKYVVGQEVAKEIKIVNFINGKSTTETIKKILKS